MSNQQKHIDEIIMLRILENRANKKEQDLFKDWLEASEEHEELYRQFKKAAELTSSTGKSAENSWEIISRKVTNGASVPAYIELPAAKTTWLGSISQNIVRVAAAVVFLIGATFLLTHIFSQPEQLIISGNNYGPDTPYTLPDGSQVFLNQNAEIQFTDHFGQTNRTLSLKGEAFFEVERNEDLPFEIDARNTTIRVLGTSFNVFSDSLDEVKVSVVTGLVEFFAEDTTAKLRLQPGEQGRYNPAQGAVEKSPIMDQNFLSWKTGVFTFDHTPVTEALQQLGYYYDRHLIYEKEGSVPEITTTFENQPIETVQEELNLLLNTTSITRNDTILFKPHR